MRNHPQGAAVFPVVTIKILRKEKLSRNKCLIDLGMKAQYPACKTLKI